MAANYAVKEEDPNPHATHEALCREYWATYYQSKAQRGDHLISIRSEIVGNVRLRHAVDRGLTVCVISDSGETREYSIPSGIDLRVGEGARVGAGCVLAQDFPGRVRRDTCPRPRW